MKDSNREKKKCFKGRTAIIVLTILLVYAAAVLLAAVVIDARHVRFYMTGPDTLLRPGRYSEKATKGCLWMWKATWTAQSLVSTA